MFEGDYGKRTPSGGEGLIDVDCFLERLSSVEGDRREIDGEMIGLGF